MLGESRSLGGLGDGEGGKRGKVFQWGYVDLGTPVSVSGVRGGGGRLVAVRIVLYVLRISYGEQLEAVLYVLSTYPTAEKPVRGLFRGTEGTTREMCGGGAWSIYVCTMSV